MEIKQGDLFALLINKMCGMLCQLCAGRFFSIAACQDHDFHLYPLL
ncbi:hypothetical protein NSQ29_28610 [Paenibacillus sp. FSL F4-0236]